MTIFAQYMRLGLIFLLALAFSASAQAGRYRFGVQGERLTLNDRPFKIIGLRVSNALISDADTEELMAHLDEFKGYGVNTVSVFVMGSRFGDVKGYLPDASLNPIYTARLGRIIEAADQRGMVVLVGCLYWSTSKASQDLGHWTQKEANRAVANTVAWLSKNNYRNVFVDVDNEGMAHRAKQWDIGQMIDAAHAVDRTLMVAYNSRETPPPQADLLVHFSPKVPGKPWVESEGTPENARGGYWGKFSKQDGYYNYIRIGRYTAAMKQDQLERTHAAIENHQGYMLASTWLQCGPAEGIGGPFMIPGGLAEKQGMDENMTQVRPDAGIRWWLESVRQRYGAWTPPPLTGRQPNHSSASSGPSVSGRPNFLFIYTDDQRYDALSVVQREQGERGRFPWFRTPHMDRLAAEGVRFRNAFVVNSLCAPSRAVNLTGRYSHFNGVASNFRPFPTNQVTHATELRAAGYTTAYVGKWHMDSQRERPGFDHYFSYTGHARYFDPIFIDNGRDTPTQGWIDDLSTDNAIEFLRRQQGRDRPWSLVLGFKAPHGPFEPPPRARQRFAGEQARVAPNLNTPTPYMGAAGRRSILQAEAATVPVNLDYFRCISAVDDCLGRLLEALDEFGFRSNTVVIYTSDNGFYLGEHGLGDKRSAYDESLRVPLLVRYPALGAAAQGRVVDEMVLNLDLAQTLLDLAGVAAPPEMQGQSWRPLLTGESHGWRQAWFYEYFAEKQRNTRVPDITAVRTRDAKLIKYPGHAEWTELFDLRADPYEMTNLFNHPAHALLRDRLEAEHDRLAREVGYVVPSYVDRPDWWGKPGGPDWKPEAKVELRLQYDPAGGEGEGTRLMDRSGQGNHGQVHGISLAEGRSGRHAWRFPGSGYVEVPKSKSLNPALMAWTVEVVAKPERPDGLLLARGGQSQGYALWFQEGRPAFTVRVNSKAVTARASEPFLNWATLTGTISADRQVKLRVNGRLAATAPLPDFIELDPHDSMQIGADLGSPVLGTAPPKFTGLIESVRIFSGEKDP